MRVRWARLLREAPASGLQAGAGQRASTPMRAGRAQTPIAPCSSCRLARSASGHARRSVWALVAAGAFASAACSPERDTAAEAYLDADLRQRVEALKNEAREHPTSAANALERARVVREWADAYALSGGQPPVVLSGSVAALRLDEALGRAPRPATLESIDSYIAELTLKDEHPDAIGALTLTTPEPLEAGEPATVEQVYTVGSAPLRPGGRIALGTQHFSGIELQTDDPAAKDFVTVRASDPQARFEPTTALLNPLHGRGSPPAFVLREATLEEGATVTVTYGDTSGGGPGLEVQRGATTALLLPVYVDLDGSGLLLSPRWPRLEVVGSDVAGVLALGPSVVAPGEPFSLTVRAMDRWRNRATGPLPAWDVLLDGERLRRIEAGAEALAVVDDLRLERPGVHRLEVVSEDGRLRATSNPILVRGGGERLVWGEMHVHAGYAEGQGTAEELYRFALEDARLDFLGYSEHDAAIDAAEWQTIVQLAANSDRPGKFAAFLGYEWTVQRELGGHHNVFFRNPDQTKVWSDEAPRLEELYRGLRATSRPEDVLVIPHAHQAGDWTQSDPDLERAVEIYSMHGTFESFGNRYLKNGWKVGFLGASDDHRSKPGYATGYSAIGPLRQDGGLAGLWVPEHSPDAIFDGLRAMRSYATSGERIVLETTLNGFGMGTEQPPAAERQIAVRVAGTAPIQRIDVVRNGEVAYARSYLTAPLRSEAWIQVGFESSTVLPETGLDNPRGFRRWEGNLEIEGATIEEVRGGGVDNLHEEYVRLDEGSPGRIRFRLETRGRRDSFLVRLGGADPSTRFVFRLEESVEQAIAQVPVRPPATIPAAEVRLELDDLERGRLEHPLPVDVHTDLVMLEVVDPEGPRDREFEWTDLAQPGDRDYYYVRVTQLDGGRAWSSPFWIGEPSGRDVAAAPQGKRGR